MPVPAATTQHGHFFDWQLQDMVQRVGYVRALDMCGQVVDEQ